MAFIVFEGIDGSGKTTQICQLEKRLSQCGISVKLTREPGGTPLAEELREMLLRKTDESPVPRCELLLYEAARSQHVERVIRPQLEAGHWVLCDRFTASTVAFQAAGRGLMPRQIQWLNEFAVAGVSPQLNILLDVTIEQSQRRRADRYGRQGGEEDRFESENQNFHRKVRESYLHQAQQDPEKWLIIEGSRSPEDIGEEIWRRLGVGGWLES